MSKGRERRGKGNSGRVAGGFIALPWSVMDCPGYKRLSHPARSLLLEVARQYVRDNNGRLLLSRAYLTRRGWNSSSVIDKAKRALLDGGFIFQTVMGHRPNKASWFAITWYRLDKLAGYDADAELLFKYGAYDTEPIINARLSPSHGAKTPAIAPSHGTGKPLTSPSHGAIKALLPPYPSPSHGHHLEMPSHVRTPTPALHDE